MAVYNQNLDARPVIAAAQHWARTCLVADGSIFEETGRVWTLENLGHLDTYFVQRPDAGEGSFYEKLQGQMADAPPAATKLMAEFLWVLLLFPSNISADTKRDGVMRVWAWSGEPLDRSHPMLQDSVLGGIGSAGTAFNNFRWREIVYLVGLAQAFKRLPGAERETLIRDYPRFMDWLETVPRDGDRQFRHMLRYFLFPDLVERMSSNGDRKRVLAGYGVERKSKLRTWTDRQLDEALLALRRRLEEQYGSDDLDFYSPPLRDVWKPASEHLTTDDDETGEAETTGVADEASDTYALPGKPRNLILYGPPGTGKTWRLQGMFDAYTDQPADVDRTSWEQEIVAQFGWRACIVVALEQLGGEKRVGELTGHPLIQAKVRQRGRTKNVLDTLHNYLQEHTSPDVRSVGSAVRREPYVFTKNDASRWSVVGDWRDRDDDAVELADAWTKGPGQAEKPVQRYRVVTFHPSYSYEEFVIGLRPVAGKEEGETATFRMVDGVFKQLCAIAKANPAKRYALFIDEINRANIAKVFGELITLIEPDKRATYDGSGRLSGGMEVQLPGTGGEDGTELRFGVPANLDIYGTMNTADRSIALLDIALRRRFEFEEMPPLYDHLHSVEGIHLGRLLRTINQRLEYLVDRDHQIGHAYFSRVNSLDDLRSVLQRQVIPLLQEYFFDDWSRIQLVLGAQAGGCPFIAVQALSGAELFPGGEEAVQADRERYTVTPAETWRASDFVSLYERMDKGS